MRMRSMWMLPVALALVMTGGVPRKAAQLNQDANKAYGKQDYDTADRLYDEAQTKAPNTAELSYNRGNVLYRQGKFGDAAANLRRATDSSDPILRQKSLYNLGNALHDLGELEIAAKAYREALKLNPADRDAKINYEKTLREMKEHPQEKKQQDKNQQQQKGQKDDKQGGKGQQGEDKDQPQDQDSQDQNGDQQQAQKPEEGKQQDAKEQQGEGKDEKQPKPDESQLAGMDSIPVDGLTREEALRILEAMRDQEKELQKQKARQVKARSRRVDKDW